MKSKTRLFLLPMLAIAIAATAFFGYANFNTPAKASADSFTTIYYYNTNGWKSVDLYAWKRVESTDYKWNGSGWTTDDIWEIEDLVMSAVDGKAGWFCYTLPADAQYVIFRDHFNHNDKSGDETINATMPYYYIDTWYLDNVYPDMIRTDSAGVDDFYVCGTINGVTYWHPTDAYKLNTSAIGRGYITLDLAAGDEIRITRGKQWNWYSMHNSGSPAYATGAVTQSGDNASIATAGTYDICLGEGGYDSGNFFISKSLDVKDSKYKLATGNTHLMVASAFNYSTLLADAAAGASAGYAVGYYVSGYHDNADIYTGITLTGAKRYGVDDIFSVSAEDYRMIVHEIELSDVDTAYTYQPYVKYNGFVCSVGKPITSSAISKA